MPADARVNIRNNRTYAEAYNQVNAMRQQGQYANTMGTTATTNSATENLPVAVDNKKLAEDILNNTSESVTVADLDACSMIYPRGVFKWAVPDSGVRRNPTEQCVSVVELRDANTKELLATATLAAGDTMKCNVDSFPELSYSYNLKYGKVAVPADNAPTMEDVVAVMNEEQKQNAGLKIAAAAIIGAAAGNLLGPKQAGSTEYMGFGGGTSRLITTAAGAAGAAGIEAASSYSGKVAGDTIKSTAVNATAGALIGNMAAGMSGSDDILTTVKCKVDDTEYNCIPVKQQTVGPEVANTDGVYYLVKHDGSDTQKCTVSGPTNPPEQITKKNNNNFSCETAPSLTNVKVGGVYFAPHAKKTENPYSKATVYAKQEYDNNEDNSVIFKKTSFDPNADQNTYYLIESANLIDQQAPAYAVFSYLKPKALGYEISDWNNDAAINTSPIEGATLLGYYKRFNDGTVGDKITKQDDEKTYKFKPLSRDASDGALIDLNNQARTKATLVGTAAGGALGGLSGYMGATSEVQERWVTAVREYNDSLSNFVCVTGDRPLAKYNDYIEIPEMKKTE